MGAEYIFCTFVFDVFIVVMFFYESYELNYQLNWKLFSVKYRWGEWTSNHVNI